MTKFKLKISGKSIEIFQNDEAIGEGDDYKEVLAYVATLIVKKNIDDYEVWLHEKGEKVKLNEKNFDPETIVKNSKKIKIEDDEDDDDNNDNGPSNQNRNHRTSIREEKPRFVYTPKYTDQDYSNIGKKLRASLSGIKIEEKKEEIENDS